MKSAEGYSETLQGFPSDAHDKAWLNLVERRSCILPSKCRPMDNDREASLSRASYEEMILGHEDPEHSVVVADENGGYMISVGVFHELHCLVRCSSLRLEPVVTTLTCSSAV